MDTKSDKQLLKAFSRILYLGCLIYLGFDIHEMYTTEETSIKGNLITLKYDALSYWSWLAFRCGWFVFFVVILIKAPIKTNWQIET